MKVDALSGDEADAAARTLARAFFDDPVWSWLMPHVATRTDQLTGMFRMLIDEVYGSRQRSYVTADRRAAALWAPPGNWELDDATLERLTPRALELLGNELGRLLGVLMLMDEHHPRAEHEYLAAIGTDPDFQGQGYGSALLGYVLDDCDANAVPAYLESSKPENVPFYEHHGFQVMEILHCPDDGPPISCMWREPSG